MNDLPLFKSCIQRKLITYLVELSFSFGLTYLPREPHRQWHHHSEQMQADRGPLPALKCLGA